MCSRSIRMKDMDKQMFSMKSALRQGSLHLAVLSLLLCGGLTVAGAAEQNAAGLASPETAVGQTASGEIQDGAIVEGGEPLLGVTEGEEAGAPEYEYQVAARPDPFKPFIAPKTVNPNELVDENLELTGMQLFEPGQLNLVAVMDTPHGRMAMVEDFTKKGYKITHGQLIGRRGQVTEIRKDEVLVTETAYTRGGEEIKTVVSMKMKRDGDSK